jgi:DNA-binding transcriptional LysR family regulator
MDHFKALEIFARVSRCENFSAAAAEMALSRAMVSKTIDRLEARLGVRLFNRTTRRVCLTAAGAEYCEFATRLLKELAERETALAASQSSAAGSIRVLAPRSFGSLHLGQALAEFSMLHPGVRVTLTLETPASSELQFGSDFDVAIRTVPLLSKNVVARHLASVRWVVCAARAYLERRAAPCTIDDLSAHNCLLHTDGFPHRTWRFGAGPQFRELHVTGTFSSNSIITLRDAAIAGVGIALLPLYACKDALLDGRLISLLEEAPISDTPLYALIPSNRLVPKRVRILLGFLAERVARVL